MFDATVQNSETSLTERQRSVLEVVRRFLADNGYPPTVREIRDELGIGSTSTVHAHLAALERAGLIVRDPTKPRAMTVADDPAVGAQAAAVAAARRDEPVQFGGEVDVERAINVPLIGTVAAGAPILAEEHVEQVVQVPAFLTRAGSSFMLHIKGDSMVEAGILDGDFVVVRQQADANDGQIVVAMVDGEATCKRLRRRAGAVELIPENSAMQPMVFDEGVSLLGVVTGVVRALS